MQRNWLKMKRNWLKMKKKCKKIILSKLPSNSLESFGESKEHKNHRLRSQIITLKNQLIKLKIWKNRLKNLRNGQKFLGKMY